MQNEAASEAVKEEKSDAAAESEPQVGVNTDTQTYIHNKDTGKDILIVEKVGLSAIRAAQTRGFFISTFVSSFSPKFLLLDKNSEF